MKIEQRHWTMTAGWHTTRTRDDFRDPQLVLVFGARSAFEHPAALADLRQRYPGARIMGCSTAGEIRDTSVLDDSIVATAIRFDSSAVSVVAAPLPSSAESDYVAEYLAGCLPADGLRHVLVLAEGLAINGSDLVAGFRRRLPSTVAVTGGLAADGDRFGRTLVYADGLLGSGMIVAAGLYGDRLGIGFGSMGGWDHFGPERIVTRSVGNVLHELDGEPALDLYRRYLGPAAAGLPASGLLFPLSIRRQEGAVVRTILGIDESARTMTFAGDIPEGSVARLMKANVDRLIDGATAAAGTSYETLGRMTPDLAILISCVGRRLVLGQRVEEETESVRNVLGATTAMTGFYSYGEIAPFVRDARCELHNQTMTITALSER